MAEASAPPKQIAMLIDYDVMDKFDPLTRDWLVSMFGSAAFETFCTSQLEIIQRDLIQLDPASMSNEDFTNLSKEMRLTWRFWTDLQRFAEGIGNNNRKQRD